MNKLQALVKNLESEVIKANVKRERQTYSDIEARGDYLFGWDNGANFERKRILTELKKISVNNIS